MAKYKPAKFRPARGKPKTQKPPPGGIACVTLLIGLFFLVMLFIYLVLKYHANG